MIMFDLRAEKRALLILGEERMYIAQGAADVGWQLAERLPERALCVTALDQDNPVQVNRVHLVCFGGEIGHSLIDSGLDQRIAVLLMGNRGFVGLEQRLVHAHARIEGPKGSL